MKNVEALDNLGILGDVRERLGANDENDTSYDFEIDRMDATDLVAKWCGWHLGDEQWGYTIISFYNQILEMQHDDIR